MIGILPWLVRWAQYFKRLFFPPLAAPDDPEKLFSSSPDTISLHFSRIAQQAGQTVVLCRLSLNKCLCSHRVKF
jgi:hypothetical protein